MFSRLGIRSRLLIGFAAVAALTAVLGVLAQWQFTRVGAVTRQSLDGTLQGIALRDQSDRLAARRTAVLQNLQTSATSEEAQRVLDSDEWRELLAAPGLDPDLGRAIAAFAPAWRELLVRRENLAHGVENARRRVQGLHARILPAANELAAQQAARARTVGQEIEQARGETIANLFVNFDATMNFVSLIIDTQAGLFRLRDLESSPSSTGPATALRAELATRLAAQTDPTARQLAAALRETPAARGPALSAQHDAYFKALSELAAAAVFNGRTTVVTTAVENINSMGERTDALQAASRTLDERRSRLESSLQDLDVHTSELLQAIVQILLDPQADRLRELDASLKSRLALASEDQKRLALLGEQLGLPWLSRYVTELHQTLFNDKDSLLAQTTALVAAHTAQDAAELRLREALAADLEHVAATARAFGESSREHADTVAQISATARRWIIVIALCALLVATILAFVFSEAIARSLRRVADSLSGTSDQVSTAANELSSASQRAATHASEQAASMDQTSSALGQIDQVARSNAAQAAEASALAAAAREATGEGARQMNELVTAMNGIKTASDNIAAIIKSIDEIAFQTNILALNAAVEAARAGEAGAGFAVVADEVRALAQRAATAARDTAERIEDAISKTTRGVQLSTAVASTLGAIESRTARVNDVVAGIADASRRQTEGVGEINAAMTRVNDATRGSAASAEEAASSSVELMAQAHALTESAASLRAVVNGRQA